MSSDQSSQPMSHWRQSLHTLNIPSFRLFIASNAAFFLAMQGQVLTRTFLAWELTHDEMSLAYINIAFAVPMLLFSLIGGVLGDRFDRQKIIMIGQLFVVANESWVLILLFTDSLAFWHLLIAGVLGGTIVPLIMPARSALVYNLVGEKKLGSAMALSSGVVNLSRVLGPAMMGVAISFFSIKGAYIISIFLFTLALFFMAGVHYQPIKKNVSNGNIRQEILLGIRYISGYPPLLVCVSFGLLPMLLALPVQNLMVVFADLVWSVGERGLGLLMGVSGLGGVLGSFWVASRGERTDRTQLMLISTASFGLLLIVFALSKNFYLALIPLFLANAAASASQTLNNTMAQILVTDEQRGRVSAFMLMAFGLTPLGVLPMAYLAQLIGIQSSTVVASVALLAAISLFYWQSQYLKQLDSFVTTKLAANQ
ncbi:MAG: MFS transporter [Pseudomonadales bacterium]|nr:MFS transporter [Pseudomonadales bacterium]